MMTSTNRWMIGTTVVAALTATVLFAQGCTHDADEDEELRVSLANANGNITVKAGGGSGTESAGTPGTTTQFVAGYATSPACAGTDNERLAAPAANVTGYNPALKKFAPAVGTAFTSSLGSTRGLHDAVADATAYTSYRKATPKWGQTSFSAVSFTGNAATGSIYHCRAGADSSAYVTPGSDLSIPITVIPNDAYIPPAANIYRNDRYVAGSLAQYWLGQYNPVTGEWSGTNWNWVYTGYSEVGACNANGCPGAVYNEPKGWVRNGNGTTGTAIARYGKRLSNGALQVLVLRPAVVADTTSPGRYRVAENGGGVEWNVPVPTTAANAIANQ